MNFYDHFNVHSFFFCFINNLASLRLRVLIILD